MDIITKADVIAEGNIKVVLPWDGCVGELWFDRESHGEPVFGLVGKNRDGRDFSFTSDWYYITSRDVYGDRTIRRAPKGAEVGDLV
jgi:hypothetical protein